MPIVRIVGGVVIVLGLAILTLQNLSPVLSLTFLGMRSQPLALGVWLLMAVSAGVITGLLLMLLTPGASGPGVAPRRSPTPKPSQGVKSSSFFQRQRPRAAQAPPSDTATDWFAEPVSAADWSAQGAPTAYAETPDPSRDAPPPPPAPPSPPPPRRQAVVDADYRELSPPYERPEEDLDFELDDEFFRDWPEDA